MKVLQQVSIHNKKKLQQAFLSLIVLNLSHQCILPGNNAKSSYGHLIKTQYTKDFQFSIASIPTKNICFKIKDAQEARLFAFLKCVFDFTGNISYSMRKGISLLSTLNGIVCAST